MSLELQEFPPDPKDGLQELRNFILFKAFEACSERYDYTTEIRTSGEELPYYGFRAFPEKDINKTSVIGRLCMQEVEEVETTLRLMSDGVIRRSVFICCDGDTKYDVLDNESAYNILASLQNALNPDERKHTPDDSK